MAAHSRGVRSGERRFVIQCGGSQVLGFRLRQGSCPYCQEYAQMDSGQTQRKERENTFCSDSFLQPFVLLIEFDPKSKLRMKKLYFYCLVMILCSSVNHLGAETLQADSDSIYLKVEEMPQYPGGTEKMNEFIRKELRKRVPKDINGGCGIPGRTVMRFVVNKDGSISDIEILRSLDPLLDKEAVRVVRKMPKWIPGKCEGKPVRTRFALAVAFHNL